jgi:DNA-binding NtrC family response regulator
VVLFDHDEPRRRELARALEDAGLPVAQAADWPAFRQKCEEEPAGVVALPLLCLRASSELRAAPADVHPELLAFLHAGAGKRDAVVFTESDPVPIGVYCKALTAGARRVLNGCSATFRSDLVETVKRLEKARRTSREEQEQLGEIFAEFGLVGTSPALREVFRRALKAGQFSDLPVLILGETGTGKQLLAEAIHRTDPRRRKKPFVTVNCGAIHQALAESELFGHVKGAFSGAEASRGGLFRAAEGGTLLLDEIGDLDPRMQPKLLRVLQERRLLPVGQDYEHAIDIRVMAATNRPLGDMAAAGLFRPDLYQRLNVFRIVVPPLRDRHEDVEAQARYFLRRWSEEHRTAVEFGPRVLEALRLLPWEGNSRQLRNVLWAALAHKEGGSLLQMEDLPEGTLEALSDGGRPAAEAASEDSFTRKVLESGLSLSQAVREYERRLLREVLRQTRGNRTQTATRLGLTPRSVFNKIKRYGLG